jgi:hypothetical protein
LSQKLANWKPIVAWLEIRSENLIKKPEVWAQIQAVAGALVKQEHLKPLEIRTICKHAFQRALEAHLRKVSKV